MISSGNDRAIPIAVVPFGFQGGNVLPEDMSNIIGNDLRTSATFEPLPRQNMISQPAQASEVIFRDWKAVGVNYVMVGNIVPAGGRLQVQYALFDVGTEQQVLTGSVTGSTDQLRDMSHYIADQSFEKLTGIKGAFSTKMLYVTAERFSVDNTRYTFAALRLRRRPPGDPAAVARAHRVAALRPMAAVSPMSPSNRSARVSSSSTSILAVVSRSPISRA